MKKKITQFPSFNVSTNEAIEIVKYKLDEPDIALQSKIMAIERVTEMENLNSLTKADLMRVLRWVFKHYDFEK